MMEPAAKRQKTEMGEEKEGLPAVVQQKSVYNGSEHVDGRLKGIAPVKAECVTSFLREIASNLSDTSCPKS